jgi:hypothetical protein
MTPQIKALFVHLFTATGAVFAMLAMLAAVEEKWSLMFLWLVVAFVASVWTPKWVRDEDIALSSACLQVDWLRGVFFDFAPQS